MTSGPALSRASRSARPLVSIVRIDLCPTLRCSRSLLTVNPVQFGMVYWLLGFIALIAFFTVFYRFVAIRFARRIGRTVDVHHRNAEHVLATRRPPEEWRADVANRFLGGVVTAADVAGREKARAALIRRLERVESYFARSPVVADEQTRAQILGNLEEIREEWQESDVAQLLSATPESGPPDEQAGRSDDIGST